MVSESQVEFPEPISYSHFLRLWREEASYIAIPKHNRFSKCDTCTLIKTKLGETRDPAKRAILIEKREKHLRLQKYVLAFMAYLVERKIFRKVKISFLIVGHTHEDVDQVFSKFSHWLIRHAATTLEKLMTGFEKCFSPRPTSIRTSDVYNITEWLTPHINAIKNHSRPHVFKITSDESGKARLFWKEWSTDKKWNETTEYILKSDVEGEPDIVVPFFDEIHDNIDRLENDVKTSFKYFAKEEDKEWWYCFFRNYDAPNDTKTNNGSKMVKRIQYTQ
uniref:DUF7869 domain-containing protein n=1 Tax=Magallana gigas TaxID=29159 RepID=K1QPN2_MAGGI